MKFFGFWTILVALVISVIAAYYSIVGLVAIFAAAALPIIIMGAALEVGKLTTAVWLHSYWKNAKWYIKTYLSIALVLLMFITSMGIFGFLSKAHIEQTALATEGMAQLQRIESDISRNTDIIQRAETAITKLENTDLDVDAGLEEKIAREQERIDTAYDRIQPAIDDQKQLLEASLKPYDDQLAAIDENLKLYKEYVAADNIKDIQRLVGTSPDGRYGPGTKKAVDEWLTSQNTQREETLSKAQELRDASGLEIIRIRGIAEKEIADSNKLIARLRDQVGRNNNAEQAALEITQQRAKIKEANVEIEALYEKKYAIEREARKLEAEVGPVKYIAELVYDDADINTLESAVRWVIIILVIVFDPLAVVLIIAGLTLIEHANARRRAETVIKKPEPLIEEPKVEQTVETKTELDLETATQQEILDEMSRLNQEIENSYGDIGDYNPMVREHNRRPTSVEIKIPTEEEDKELDKEVEQLFMESVENDPLDAYNDDRLASKYDLEAKAEPEVFEDSQGKYTIDTRTGQRKYLIDQYQYELNKKAKQKRNLDTVINRMKKDGYWPTVGNERASERKIEEMLAKADQKTLDEVYAEITKDLNQKKEI